MYINKSAMQYTQNDQWDGMLQVRQPIETLDTHRQVIGEASEGAAKRSPLEQVSRVGHEPFRVKDDVAKHVPVDLSLNGVKVELPVSSEGVKTVYIGDKGDALMEKAKREDVAILLGTRVQQCHGVLSEVCTTAQQPVAFDQMRLSWSPASHAHTTSCMTSFII